MYAKSTVYGLVLALIIAIAVPPIAQAGSLTIKNHNCKTLKGGKNKKWVKVHVYAPFQSGGTNEWVKVNVGESKKITLSERYTAFDGKTYRYYYRHEAQGTTGGARDVLGTEDSVVSCKKGRIFNICQCQKDYM